MAFEKKTWTDRVAEFINRRTLTKEDGSTELVTVARSEGTISKEGDAFNAETMNDLEQRIEDSVASLNNDLANLSTNLTKHKTSNDHDDRYYTESEIDNLLKSKQNSLICDTYVNTETANSNGSITLGIDVSGFKLKEKPKCAFLQGQHTSFKNYIYAYDDSTETLAVFVVNYGEAYANTAITNRYGLTIIK